jgi:amino acid transporter
MTSMSHPNEINISSKHVPATMKFHNGTTFKSPVYVCLIGMLAAASTFTGYDTAAHCAEETTNSHASTPASMVMAVGNCFVLGLILIVGMNACITDIDSLIDPDANLDAATLLWQQTVGDRLALFFQIIVFVGIECSNCANLTSCSRMVSTLIFYLFIYILVLYSK